MKKILIISCVFPPEPVVSAQLSVDIAEGLSKNNVVTVLSPKPTRPLNFKFNSHFERMDFKHIVVDSYTCPESKFLGRLRESYSFGKACQKYILKNHKNIDIIYQNSWPLFSQRYIIKAAKKFGIPVLTHVQDIYPESLLNKLPAAKTIFKNLLLPIDKHNLEYSKKVLCISENMKNTLMESRKLPESKFEIVVNWQNEENFINYHTSKKDQQSQHDEIFTLMYLGNNGPVAGVDFLIETFVKANLKNARLIIAGSGSKTEDCKKLAKQLNAKNIEFIPVPEGKVPEIQDIADVMLLPVKKNSAYSSIPSKLPAYMFSKKPIIGSLDLDSDTAKAIVNANAGIVVEPENEEKLIEAMQQLSKWDKGKLLQNGENGFNYAMEHLSKKINLNKVVQVIMDT